jgi:hypothetical protein
MGRGANASSRPRSDADAHPEVKFARTVLDRSFISPRSKLSFAKLLAADGDRSIGPEARFLRGDQAQSGPIEIAISARYSGDQPISHHAPGWHRYRCFIGLCWCAAHIHGFSYTDPDVAILACGSLDPSARRNLSQG